MKDEKDTKKRPRAGRMWDGFEWTHFSEKQTNRVFLFIGSSKILRRSALTIEYKQQQLIVIHMRYISTWKAYQVSSPTRMIFVKTIGAGPCAFTHQLFLREQHSQVVGVYQGVFFVRAPHSVDKKILRNTLMNNERVDHIQVSTTSPFLVKNNHSSNRKNPATSTMELTSTQGSKS